MKLSELLNGVKIISSKQDADACVDIVFSDSRKANTNGVFVAIKGKNRNGNDYIDKVLDKGAKCVITDDIEAFKKHGSTVLVENSRQALACMWNNYYKNPTSNMKLVAITGTNGKTSCAYYIYNILKQANKKRGLISTVECLINDEPCETNGGSDVLDISSAMTTPDPEILYSLLDKMRKEGVEYVVMEASSHALEQFKIAPLKIDVGIFTNLSSEHLDFHLTMENYFASKKKLLKNCKTMIVNADDEYGSRLLNEHECSVLGCSMIKDSDFTAGEIKLSKCGCEYAFSSKGHSFEIKGKISGAFSVYNTMLAAACALTLGFDEEKIINGILETEKIKGRMEKIGDSNVFVDYAHTPYAMKNILTAIKGIFPNKRIVTLFGCGGDRDKSKRSEMGKIASAESDKIIITSDNSRNEAPISILKDILEGISDDADFVLIPKRAEAIEYGVKCMGENDVLLLLGKGHEDYEIDSNGKHYFSERKIVEDLLRYDKN